MSSVRIFPVLLAGGASSRLWPTSANNKPKWDLRLFEGPAGSTGRMSLLESTFARARKVADAADCFVVTSASQAELVRRSLPELPAQNVLVEPEMRDTAGAVAYGAGAVAKRATQLGVKWEDAVMLVLPGDHVIRDLDRFAICAKTAANAAVELGALMTFGIVPLGPNTGYGYVQRGAEIKIANPLANAPSVNSVAAFKEKPDLATAEKYVSSGEYYWNGGIFAWQLSTLMSEFERQLPTHHTMVTSLAATGVKSGEAGQALWDAVASASFPTLKKTSIDFGIMEGAKKVATVRADFDWDDIGSWSAVGPHLPASGENRVAAGGTVFSIDSKQNVVFASGKRVALVGVEGLAVIQDGDDILICKLDRDQDVKKINEMAKTK